MDIMLKIAQERIPLDFERQSLIQLDAQIEVCGKERDRWFEEMKRYNTDGRTDQAQWTVLKGNFDFEDQRFGGLLSQKVSVGKSHSENQIALSEKVSREILHVMELSVPALGLMRGELEIATDIGQLQGIHRAAAQSQEAVLGIFFQAVRQAISSRQSQI